MGTTVHHAMYDLWARASGTSIVVDDFPPDETAEGVEHFFRSEVGIPVKVDNVPAGFRVEVVDE